MHGLAVERRAKTSSVAASQRRNHQNRPGLHVHVRVLDLALQSTAKGQDATSPSTSAANSSPANVGNKILVLGGSGFLGSAICAKLSDMGIPYVSTSTNGRDGTIPLDLTQDDDADVELRVADMIVKNGCDAVISTVGSINTPNDEKVNAASGRAAVAARMGGAKRFVFIGNAPKIRELSKTIPFLKGYAAGKEEAEGRIRDAFGPTDYCIVQPTFIYGGRDFGINPPRVESTVGQFAEELLGLYPLQAVADALPGALGVPLSPPVSRERVASAAINAALGLNGGLVTLEGSNIVAVASRRPSIIKSDGDGEAAVFDTEEAAWEERQELKRRLFSLGPEGQEEATAIMEQLENLRPSSVRPIEDPTLNGRWDFVFDVEPDIGTGVIRTLIEDPPPMLGPIFNLNDVRMEIENNRIIRIVVATKVLGQDCDLVLSTSLLPDESDVAGTTVLERFEGIEVGGNKLPVPDSWKRSRPLEISFLDEDMLIARGNGGEPHFLMRDK